mgnify:CR=1 FL=1
MSKSTSKMNTGSNLNDRQAFLAKQRDKQQRSMDARQRQQEAKEMREAAIAEKMEQAQRRKEQRLKERQTLRPGQRFNSNVQPRTQAPGLRASATTSGFARAGNADLEGIGVIEPAKTKAGSGFFSKRQQR